MKKQLLLFVLSLLTLGALTACGDTQEEAPVLPHTNVLADMSKPNSNEALVSKYGRVASETEFTFVDGSTDTLYQYADSQRYYEEGSYYWVIDQDGTYYEFDDNTEDVTVNLFVGDAYEPVLAAESVSGYSYTPGIEVVTALEKDEDRGITTVHSSTTDAALTREYPYAFGYEPGSVQEIRFDYVIRTKNLELQSMEVFFVLEDGQLRSVLRKKMVDEVEAYVPDAEIQDRIFEADTRSITIIVDAGLETEEICQFKPPVNVQLRFRMPAGYDSDLYTDDKCTQVFPGIEDPVISYILYTKSTLD